MMLIFTFQSIRRELTNFEPSPHHTRPPRGNQRIGSLLYSLKTQLESIIRNKRSGNQQPELALLSDVATTLQRRAYSALPLPLSQHLSLATRPLSQANY